MSENLHAIAAGSLVFFALFLLSYTGVQYFNTYKQEKSRALELQIAEENDRQLELAAKESLRAEEIAILKQELADLQSKVSEEKPPQKTTTFISTSPGDTTSSVVKEWSPRLAHIECDWFNDNGKLYAKGSGSGTLVNFTSLGVRAITNKHLLVYKGLLPRECNIELLDGTKYKVLVNNSNVNIGTDEDWAYITLKSDSILSKITKQTIKTCTSVDIGDKLLVLGYPKIGSTTGLTVTEGIVSGNDKNYYITSAKIDKGNSGGAAILIKDSCYLGIPSSSVIGSIESLGRILKASFVIGG